MKFTPLLLEYYKLDHEIYKAEEAFNNSKNKLRYNELKARHKAAQIEYAQLESECQALFKEIGRLSTFVDELKIEKPHFNNNDLTALDIYEKQYTDIKEKITESLKEIKRCQDRLYASLNQYSRIVASATKLGEELQGVTAELNNAQREIAAQFKESRRRLEEIKPKISLEVMAVYERIRQNPKLKTFLGMYSEPYCLACGMDVAAEVSKLLKEEDDIAQCSSCGRLLYLQKK